MNGPEGRLSLFIAGIDAGNGVLGGGMFVAGIDNATAAEPAVIGKTWRIEPLP